MSAPIRVDPCVAPTDNRTLVRTRTIRIPVRVRLDADILSGDLTKVIQGIEQGVAQALEKAQRALGHDSASPLPSDVGKPVFGWTGEGLGQVRAEHRIRFEHAIAGSLARLTTASGSDQERAPTSKHGRAWHVRRTAHFHSRVSRFLEFVEATARLPEDWRDLHHEVLEQVRPATAWLVEIEAPLPAEEVEQEVLRHAASTLGLDEDHELVAGCSAREPDRRTLLRAVEHGNIEHEIPALDPQHPRRWLLCSWVVVPRVRRRDRITIERRRTVLLPQGTARLLFGDDGAFERGFGVSFSTYANELRSAVTTVRLELIRLLRRTSVETIRALVRPPVARDAAIFSRVIPFTAEHVAALPPALAQPVEALGPPSGERWLHLWTTIVPTADELLAAQLRPHARRLASEIEKIVSAGASAHAAGALWHLLRRDLLDQPFGIEKQAMILDWMLDALEPAAVATFFAALELDGIEGSARPPLVALLHRSRHHDQPREALALERLARDDRALRALARTVLPERALIELVRGFFEGYKEVKREREHGQWDALLRQLILHPSSWGRFGDGFFSGIGPGAYFSFSGIVDLVRLVPELIRKLAHWIEEAYRLGHGDLETAVRARLNALLERLEHIAGHLTLTLGHALADPRLMQRLLTVAEEHAFEVGRRVANIYYDVLEAQTPEKMGYELGFAVGLVAAEIALGLLTEGIADLAGAIARPLAAAAEAIASAIGKGARVVAEAIAELFTKVYELLGKLRAGLRELPGLDELFGDLVEVVKDFERWLADALAGEKALAAGAGGGRELEDLRLFAEKIEPKGPRTTPTRTEELAPPKPGAPAVNAGKFRNAKLGRKLGEGGNKTFFAVVDNDEIAIGVLKKRAGLSELQKELTMLRQLEAEGLPTAEVYGITTSRNDYAVVMKRYAEGSKTAVKLVGDRVQIVGGSAFLNERSIRDLEKIRSILEEKRIRIDDLQFLIGHEGDIVIADPLELLPGLAPSKRNRDMIDLLVQLARENVARKGIR
jgi:hypothetical protein